MLVHFSGNSLVAILNMSKECVSPYLAATFRAMSNDSRVLA